MWERSVVIVSPHFPPSSAAAAHRARHLAKHLPGHGWRPIVVTVDERVIAEPLDPGLAQLLPAGLRQVRVGALPAPLLRRVGVGDIGLRSYPYLARALNRVCAEEKPAILFMTGFPFYPMLLAPKLKRRFGMPIVLDFQDPWVCAHAAAPWSKAGLAHALAALLEPKIVRAADFITSVSEIQNAQMAARYPWLDRARMAAIPIGGDPADFEALRNVPAASPAAAFDPAFIHISYVGAYWPRAELAVRALFRAMAGLRAASPALAGRLRFHFIGTGETPLAPLIHQEGVADLVEEAPARIPFIDALGVLANSHGLLMFGSDEPHYTASKIYPNLMAERPFLSLFHRDSSAHAILTAAGGGKAFGFDTQDSLDALGPALTEGLVTLATRPETFGTVNRAAYAPYTAEAVAGNFARIFDRLAISPSSTHPAGAL